MEKIVILYENEQWLEPIVKALHKIGIPLKTWFLDQEGSFDLFKEPQDVLFFNRMSPSAHTRGHHRSYEYTSSLLSWLKFYNKETINGFFSWQIENSKILQYNYLRQSNIKVPYTIAAFSKTDVALAAGQMKLPFLLKHNRGGKGTGVHLFHTLQACHSFLKSDQLIDSPDGITLLQEYIESEESYVYRLEFIGRKFFYAVKMDTRGGFALCPADACAIKEAFCPIQSQEKFTILRDFPHPQLIAAYEKFIRKHDIDVAGIECVIDKKGTIYTYDINTNTNYNQAAESKEGGKSAYTQLAEFLAGCNQKRH